MTSKNEKFWEGLGIVYRVRDALQAQMDDAEQERRVVRTATAILFVLMLIVGTPTVWWVIAHSVPHH